MRLITPHPPEERTFAIEFTETELRFLKDLTGNQSDNMICSYQWHSALPGGTDFSKLNWRLYNEMCVILDDEN